MAVLLSKELNRGSEVVRKLLHKQAFAGVRELMPRPEAEGFGELYELEIVGTQLHNDFNDDLIRFRVRGNRDRIGEKR